MGGGVKANTQNTSKTKETNFTKENAANCKSHLLKEMQIQQKNDKYCRKSKIFLKGTIETNGMGYTCCFNFKTAFCSHFLFRSISFHSVSTCFSIDLVL